jgi:LysM repeat protein
MQAVRQMGSGILYGLVSVLLVVGGLSLALAESYIAPSPTPIIGLPTVLQTLTSTQAGPAALPSSTSLPSATPLPPTNCPPPAGWILISVEPYDTVESLAGHFKVSPDQLAQANCLLTNNLEPGYNIYVPLPPSSANPVPNTCSAPFGWVRAYVVRPGDSLHQIAALYGVSLFELQNANCLSTTYVSPGERLWVPIAPVTPSVIIINIFGTLTPTASQTQAPSNTPTLLQPTGTASSTATITLSPSPTVPSSTPTVTAFPTSVP